MNTAKQGIIEAFRARRKRGLFRDRLHAELPESAPGQEYLSLTGEPPDQRWGLKTRDDAARLLANNEQAVVLLHRKARFPFAPVFASVLKDEQGNAWDLLLEGSCAIEEAGKFIPRYGMHAVTPESPLTMDLLFTWIVSTIRPMVKDKVAGCTISDLREKEILPAGWWEKQLLDWFATSGLSFGITSVRWESADAERAEAEGARQSQLAQLARASVRERETELQELKAQNEYELERVRIDTNKKLSEREREQELERLELSHRKKVISLEQEADAAAHAKQVAVVQHEIAIARLNNDLAAERNAQDRLKDGNAQHEETVTALTKASSVIERFVTLGEPLLHKLMSADLRTVHQAAERLVSPEFGIASSTLAALGYGVGKQALVQMLARKQVAGEREIMLSKSDLVTRDVGAAKVKALPIGRSLQFKIESGCAGCVTVLNFGTSGEVFVHVPSALVANRSVTVVANRQYFIPGPELFPWQWDYREEGPAGWEHMVGIVSDEPVLVAECLARSSAEAPIVKLTSQEVDQLHARLEALPAGSWTSHVLSFLVAAP